MYSPLDSRAHSPHTKLFQTVTIPSRWYEAFVCAARVLIKGRKKNHGECCRDMFASKAKRSGCGVKRAFQRAHQWNGTGSKAERKYGPGCVRPKSINRPPDRLEETQSILCTARIAPTPQRIMMIFSGRNTHPMPIMCFGPQD